LVRGIETDVLPVAEKYGMGVIPWSPLAGGWLTGRYRKGQDIPETHRAQRIPGRYDLSIPGNQAKLDAVEELAVLAEDAGLSLIHLALAFTLPSRCHRADHRTPDNGAARVPTGRRRRHAERGHP
jgi:aryl-alcohol dehydrogenase-like predicted oxidoreductase